MEVLGTYCSTPLIHIYASCFGQLLLPIGTIPIFAPILHNAQSRKIIFSRIPREGLTLLLWGSDSQLFQFQDNFTDLKIIKDTKEFYSGRLLKFTVLETKTQRTNICINS